MPRKARIYLRCTLDTCKPRPPSTAILVRPSACRSIQYTTLKMPWHKPCYACARILHLVQMARLAARWTCPVAASAMLFARASNVVLCSGLEFSSVCLLGALMTLPATHANRDPMTLPTLHLSREDWLTAAVEELRPSFAAIYAPVPKAIRVACGFPSNARRSGAIGECWADTASADGTIEILISPTVADPAQVFEVLVHELSHSTAGAMNHGAPFQAVASAMHLVASGTGKQSWKSTGPAAGFFDAYSAIISSLGAYPHAALSLAEKPKQATRMLKASCPTCGYTVRLTQKWASLSLPICGTDGESFILETGAAE